MSLSNQEITDKLKVFQIKLQDSIKEKYNKDVTVKLETRNSPQGQQSYVVIQGENINDPDERYLIFKNQQGELDFIREM